MANSEQSEFSFLDNTNLKPEAKTILIAMARGFDQATDMKQGAVILQASLNHTLNMVGSAAEPNKLANAIAKDFAIKTCEFNKLRSGDQIAVGGNNDVVLASAETLGELEEKVKRYGYDPAKPLYTAVPFPDDDTDLGGAQLGR